MRNVNNEVWYYRARAIKFYINYEECKLIRKYINPIPIFRFILTMRNVNNLV